MKLFFIILIHLVHTSLGCLPQHDRYSAKVRHNKKLGPDSFSQWLREEYAAAIKADQSSSTWDDQDNSKIRAKVPANSKIPYFCYLPPEKGNCSELLIRWAFDPRHDDCVKFIFKGCRSNLNNFVNREQCRESCADDLIDC